MIAILLGAVVLIVVVAMISYGSAAARRQEPGTLSGIGAAPPRPMEASPGLDLRPHMGKVDKDEGELPQFDEQPITTDYEIAYSQRIHVNKLFLLRVCVGGQCPRPVGEAGQPVEAHESRGALSFTHRYLKGQTPVPDPTIQVELKFAEDEFLATTTNLTKPFTKGQVTQFVFPVKPLKSEDLSLVVEISYLGLKWVPQTITEIKVTDADGTMTKTTTMTPAGFAQDVQLLVRENLTIQAKGFLNLNASSLNILSKAAAVALTAAYVTLAIGLKLTDNTLNAVVVGITAITTTVGIPFADDLWSLLTAEE